MDPEYYALYYQETILYGPVLIVIVIIGICLNFFALKVLYYGELLYQSREAMSALCSAGLKISILIHFNEAETKFESYRPKKLQRRITIYLIWIIYADLAVLLCSTLTFTFPLFIPMLSIEILVVYFRLVPLWHVFVNTTFNISSWIMFTLIADRYVHICETFTSNYFTRILSTKKLHKLLFLECVFIIFLTSPRFFEVINDSFLNSSLYIVFYRFLFGVLITSVIPYIITIFMCYKVLRTLTRANYDFYLSTGIHQQSSESNKIFATFIWKFLISHLLPILLDFVEFYLGPVEFDDSNFCMRMVRLSNILVLFVSSLNLGILYISSPSFRKTTRFLLRRYCK